MIDKNLATLTDEELIELLVSLEAIDSALANKKKDEKGGNNDEEK